MTDEELDDLISDIEKAKKDLADAENAADRARYSGERALEKLRKIKRSKIRTVESHMRIAALDIDGIAELTEEEPPEEETPTAKVLNVYPGAYLAAAPFLLADYEGPLERLERQSDLVQGDVLPDSKGKRSLSSIVTNISDSRPDEDLGTFAGADELRVVVQYDQSGNENHIISNSTFGRTAVVDGAIVKDSFGNPGYLYDGVGNRGNNSVILHAPVNLDDITVFVMAEPEWLTGVTGPDTVFFAFEDKGEPYNRNEFLSLWLDGAYDRFRMSYGNGISSTLTLGFGPTTMLDQPQVLVFTGEGNTVRIEMNASTITGSKDRTIPPPTTNIFLPFQGEPRKNPLSNVLSSIVLYPRALTKAERDEWANQVAGAFIWSQLVGEDPDAILPQLTQDDIDLYAYLKDFVESDFDIPQDAITYTPSGATVRDLYGTWYGLNKNLPRTHFLCYPSNAFLLDDGAGEGIEGDGTSVRVLKSSGGGSEGVNLEGTWFYTFNQPGISNPYFNHPGLANRLVTQAIAAMMQVRFEAKWGTYGSYPEYVGMMVMQNLTAFNAAKSEASFLSKSLRDAFYRTVNSIMEAWDGNGGPKDANTNMDTKTFYGLSLLYKGASEEGLTEIANNALALSKKWLLGSGVEDPAQARGDLSNVIFHPAGYIGERSQPETSYNGISIYYIAKAAAVVNGVAGWEWLWDTGGILDRMAKFKSYQIFRDPDGRFNGPSGYAVRTAFPYAQDQSSSLGRDMIVAQLSDYGIEHFNKRKISTALTMFEDPPLATVESDIQSSLSSFDFTPLPPNYRVINTASIRWWADRIGAIAEIYYDPSFYDRISSMISSSDEGLQLPIFKRPYNVPFKGHNGRPEFWAFSGESYAAFVESFSINPAAQKGYSSWRGGGSIQSFWTEDAGLVINSRSAKHDHDALKWPAIETWATHHMWGVLADGRLFSSAQRDSRITWYEYDDNDNPTTLTAINTPDRDTGIPSGEYTRTIVKEENGIRVTSEVEMDTLEVWESIPIFISYDKTTNAITTIEYTKGSGWFPLTTTPVTGITQIRLGRNHGSGIAYVYITPTTPQTMKLAPEWRSSYQAPDYFRQLMIASSNVTYTIQAA